MEQCYRDPFPHSLPAPPVGRSLALRFLGFKDWPNSSIFAHEAGRAAITEALVSRMLFLLQVLSKHLRGFVRTRADSSRELGWWAAVASNVPCSWRVDLNRALCPTAEVPVPAILNRSESFASSQ